VTRVSSLPRCHLASHPQLCLSSASSPGRSLFPLLQQTPAPHPRYDFRLLISDCPVVFLIYQSWRHSWRVSRAKRCGSCVLRELCVALPHAAGGLIPSVAAAASLPHRVHASALHCDPGWAGLFSSSYHCLALSQSTTAPCCFPFPVVVLCCLSHHLCLPAFCDDALTRINEHLAKKKKKKKKKTEKKKGKFKREIKKKKKKKIQK